mmetsp:Transcript_91914/g.260215  ORF Transcript_91914/g.260215 Transcript_91914/m.260215 type:complete len:224 (+) Transcript_91914:1-672(+)
MVGKLGPNGLPMGVEADSSAGKSLTFAFVLTFLPRAIGFGIAFAIYKLGGTAAYDAKITVLAANDLHYLYCAVAIFGVIVAWLNLFPALYKDRVVRGNSGNLRANMIFYKMNHPDGTKSPVVVMEEKGSVGMYNRANRSLHHFIETANGVLLSTLLAGFVFPFPAGVLILIFGVGRVLHQVGYAEGGYGKHAPGFMVAILSGAVMEMLVLLSGIKAWGQPAQA